MAGLDPAIHAFLFNGTKDVDARHKAAGHDELQRVTGSPTATRDRTTISLLSLSGVQRLT
jgi:hypothetical protein